MRSITYAINNEISKSMLGKERPLMKRKISDNDCTHGDNLCTKENKNYR